MTTTNKTTDKIAVSGKNWEDWNLGGNIRVKAYIDRAGNSVVWYPPGIVDSSLPTLAVFAKSDEEWTNPIRWVEGVTFEQAHAIGAK
tara:strand:+ start:1917 stop:2177 length:261 start_codon:yes stop_codon:yes gene_type:complete